MTTSAARTGGLLPWDLSLGFEQTVPRALAHRSQIGEVFVADSAQTSEDDHYLSFQIPRAHSLWSDAPRGHHDPFASAEAARQAIFVMLHRHLGVPVQLPFSLQRITLHVEDPEAYAREGNRPLQGFLHYRVTGRERRGADVVGMRLAGSMEIGGRPALSLTAQLAFMSQGDYDVFRSYQRARKPLATARLTPSTPLPPAAVGRGDPRNVVIGAAGDGTAPTADRYLLVADRTHPAFFDHEYDHVPGPLMVEGMRQAAVAAAGRAGALRAPSALLTGCEADFLDFAEFEADLAYETEVGAPGADGRLSVEVAVRQFGNRVVAGRIELLPLGHAPASVPEEPR
ncbi:AfsA-related hotdog domain-containing protein [Streptomyces sp. 891-h]|uniref:AfsA-related hotdog domain-containing protein n=1 Tax=Streptomyces sp. 891-h TaxID=2720714 RepID=UPI001FAA9DB2|nr:AfsA-related hotdog domain-containing protein [Streptomyces sp. 891-h]UNZ19547.1 hypothetical protein HC362_23425 [Streptomyces sp. 891-h]